MLERLKQVIVGPQTTRFAECRHCGARVDDANVACHECGSTEVAQYNIRN